MTEDTLGTSTLRDLTKIATRLDSVGEAATLQMANRARQLRAEGRSIISLSTGEPDFPTPRNIKDAATRAIEANFTRYTAAEGMLELRSVCAEKFTVHNGIQTSPDRIQISSGGKHAISNALMTLLDTGDEVIIPSPYWVSYPAMVSIADGVSKFVETTLESRWRMDPTQLANAITSKTKVLILNTPVNPTSVMYSEEELRSFVPIIADSGIYVIVDELYEHLVFDNRKHFSIGSIDTIADQVITVNGLSKAYAMTGWRLGYATGPRKVIEAMNRLQSQAVSHPSSISQMAAIEALSGPQDSVEHMRQAFQKRRDLVVERMSKVAGVKFAVPEAAFYLFFDVSSFLAPGNPHGYTTAGDICAMLLDQYGVAVVAGDSFGCSNAIRLSFAASEADIVEGIERISEGLDSIR